MLNLEWPDIHMQMISVYRVDQLKRLEPFSYLNHWVYINHSVIESKYYASDVFLFFDSYVVMLDKRFVH